MELVKIKTLRPWPEEDIKRSDQVRHAYHCFGVQCHRLDGERDEGHYSAEVNASSPVHGRRRMTMPPEIIVEEIERALGIRSTTLAARG